MYVGNDDDDDDDGLESGSESFERRASSTLSTASVGNSANVSTTIYVGPRAAGNDGPENQSLHSAGDMELRLSRRTSNWDKFRLLMWKNFLLQWRHKTQAIIEILVPVLFSALLVLIRYLVDPTVFDQPTHYKPFGVDTLEPSKYAKIILYIIADRSPPVCCGGDQLYKTIEHDHFFSKLQKILNISVYFPFLCFRWILEMDQVLRSILSFS